MEAIGTILIVSLTIGAFGVYLNQMQRVYNYFSDKQAQKEIEKWCRKD